MPARFFVSALIFGTKPCDFFPEFETESVQVAFICFCPLHSIEPLVDPIDPLVDLIEPLVDLIEPFVDLIEPPFDSVESLVARLLQSDDRHRLCKPAHHSIVRCQDDAITASSANRPDSTKSESKTSLALQKLQRLAPRWLAIPSTAPALLTSTAARPTPWSCDPFS